MKYKNTIPERSIANVPRGTILLNGTRVSFLKAEINTTTYFLADTFSLELPLTGQPKGIDDAYFSITPAIMAEIYIGFPKDPENYKKEELTEIIAGQVDQIDIDYATNLVTLSGRDLTAKFIDNKTTQKFPNLTASQIVEKLAQKEGLKAEVTATSTPAGVYYANNHSTITAELPEWDLITFLAQQENFIAYVKGTTLYFHPVPTEQDIPYLLQFDKKTNDYYSFNGSNLKLSRSLTVARDVIVIVKSWNSSSKSPFTVRVKATPNKKTALASKAQPIGDAQTFTYRIPGLTREQALQRAQQLLKNLTVHERKIEASMPGDGILEKVSVTKLAGTQTDFDQIYFTSSISRTLSSGDSEGYKMEISAKNHSPNSEVTF